MVIESRWFEGFFMLLTFYAIFAPDLDLLYGTKESQVTLSIVTSFVCLFFLAEIVLQMLGRPQYTCQTYFWLDTISFISILPDTWFMMLWIDNGQFVAARSSRIAEVLLTVIKSSKASRLNRWRRMARVAAFLPRLQRVINNPLSAKDCQRLLDKKLRRIFHYLDEDSDGLVSVTMAESCIARIFTLSGVAGASGTTWAAKVRKTESITRLPSSAHVEMEGFRDLVLGNPHVADLLWASCRLQIQRGNNMHAVSSRKNEFIAVKVTLAILLLLFMLSFIQDKQYDTSAQWGLTAIDRLVRSSFANHSDGSPVPRIVQEQVRAWARDRTVLYLDLDQRIYCNSVTVGGPACSFQSSSDVVWGGLRTRLDVIDQELRHSSNRRSDLVLVKVPDFDSSFTFDSAEELSRVTTAIAILCDRKIIEERARMAVWTICVVVLFILVGIGSLVRDLSWFSRKLLSPLVEICDEMESMSRLQLAGASGHAEEDTHLVKELRIVHKMFKAFQNGLLSWGKYVPWPVVQLFMREDAEPNLEVTDAEVTVFFSDIASFTTIVENLPPERSLTLLSRYFHDMSKIIDEYKGIVIDYVGDAIFAVYNAPIKNQEHATSAVKAAVHMLRCLRSMNEWFVEHDLPEVNIRCGIHTGRVLVGNMGFRSRMKYGVVGEDSEIPSFLEEMNKNYSTKLLISHETVSRLSPETFIVRPIDCVYLREASPGDSSREPEVVYEVLDRNTFDRKSQQLTEAAEVHAVAFYLYRKMKFRQAAAKFSRANTLMSNIFGEDVPSSMMLKRCKAYMGDPPPPEWDGVWDRDRERLLQ